MPAPYDVLVEVLAFGRLRFGEAAALRRGRCDLLRSRLLIAESVAEVSGRVIVGPTKTLQQTAVVLPGFVREHLAAHLAGQEGGAEDFVFTAPGGGPGAVVSVSGNGGSFTRWAGLDAMRSSSRLPP